MEQLVPFPTDVVGPVTIFTLSQRLDTLGLHMTGKYGLLTTELQGHVQHLRDVSDVLAEALSLAQGAGAPPDAFGVLFTSVPGDLGPMVEQAVDAVRDAVDSVSTSTDLVIDTIAEYDEVERGNAETFAP